jgi:hypothetical protein
MSIPPTDDDLARAYEIFRKNHDAGRERLLGMLSDDVSHVPAIRRRRMRTVFRVLALQPLFGHWRGKLTAAAVLFAAMTIGFYALWHAPEQAAYALDDLPSRLLEIKSIYITGWESYPGSMPEQDKGASAKYPVKIFAERPDCYWHTWYGFNGPDTTHKDTRVRSGYVAGKGTRQISVSASDKTAVETTVAPIQNELYAEMFLQEQLPQQWLSGHLHDFVKTGTETIGNVLCDVYEHSFDLPKSKNRLWLDPKTGFPVKIASYGIGQTGRETLSSLFDHVEVNISAGATGLSFDLPKSYRVTKAAQSQMENPLSQPVSSGSNGDISLGVWHCFNIDDKAVLSCWYCEPRLDSKPVDSAIQPEFMLAGTRPCNHKEIASTNVAGHHWNWSLIWPQAAERIGSDDFSVIYRPKQGGSLSMVNLPLHLREDRLKAVLEEIQRITNTSVPGSPTPLSLNALREQLHH